MKQSVAIFGALLFAAAGCVMASPTHGLGAVIEGDVADPAVKAAASFVTEKANTNNCNGLCASLRDGPLRLVEILSVRTQVVAGTLYKMELLMEDTKGQQVLFTCTVWSRPWLEGSNSDEEANHITKFHYQYVDP